MAVLTLAFAAVLSLQATELRRLPAPDAGQGVASDGQFLYAIDNHVIAKLDAASGGQELIRSIYGVGYRLDVV